jgi:hypothetical protein
MQANAHKAFEYVFEHPGPMKAPWQLRTVVSIPGVQHVAARVIGLGVLPEHVAGARKKPACDGAKLKKIAVVAGLALAGIALGLRAMRRRKPSYGWS